MMKRLAIFFSMVMVAAAASAQQGTPYQSYALGSNGQPVPGATVKICSLGATGTPCTPAASIFTDVNLSNPMSNPFTADSLGNFQFFAASAVYIAQISGPGITTFTYPIATPLVGNVSNIYTAPQTFDALAFSSQVVTFSSTPAFNASLYGIFQMTLLGNVTSSSVTGQVNGQFLTFDICQNSTGGYSFAWPASFLYAPTVSPSPNECTTASFFWNGTNWIFITNPSQGLVYNATLSQTALDVEDCGGQVFNAVCPQWGADPTGTNDSTTNIYNACQAAGQGGTLYMPDGVFKVSSSISCPPYMNILTAGSANGTGSGGKGTVINWVGSGNGPIFSEIGTGVGTGNTNNRGTRIEGLTMENNGSATALVGVYVQDMQSVHFDHMNAQWGGGYCIELAATIQVERSSFGPDMNFFCGGGTTAGMGDVGFVKLSGAGSFGYTSILGPHLDGHSIDVSGGAHLYHTDLIYKTNETATDANITTATSGDSIQNSFWSVHGEGASGCVYVNLASNSTVSGSGIFDINGCGLGANTGKLFLITPSAESDSNQANSYAQGQLVPALPGSSSSFYTVATDRNDAANTSALPTFLATLGVNASGGYSEWSWMFNSLTTGRGCVDGWYNLGATRLWGLCDYGLILPNYNPTAARQITYGDITTNAVWTSSPKGTVVWCSNCDNVAVDGATAGALCSATSPANPGTGAPAIHIVSADWQCN